VKKELQALVLLLILLTATIALAACLDDDPDEEEPAIIIDGKVYDLEKLFDTFSTRTIMGSNEVEYTGIPLSDLINDTGLVSQENHQYRIIAGDGYAKNVTWVDLYHGVLVEKDTMTAFTHLPGKYRVREVVEIKKVNTNTITVNDWLYTWDQPFDKLDEVTMEDNESTTHTGVRLSDLVNDTGLDGPETYAYNISAADGYYKEVSWENMTEGLLAKDGRRSVFPELEKKYWVSDIIEIEVVET